MRKTNRPRVRGSWLLAGVAATAVILQINWSCAPGGVDAEAGEDLALLGLLNQNLEPSTPTITGALASDNWGPGGVPLNASSQPYKNSNGYLPVLLERVTYCAELRWPKTLNLCKRWHTPAEYSAWTAAGVPEGKRKDTYISRLTPWVTKSQTRFLVFSAAGQQPPGNGVDNGVTGQWAGYKSAFEKTTGARWVEMDNNSMMRKAMEAKTTAGNKLFDVNETFMASAYDTKFNQLVGEDKKKRMENAYFNWLKSKADPAKLKLIYLAGSSRGGCLVLRLAVRFRQDPQFKNVPLILQSFDGTCSKNGTLYDDRLNITWSEVSNPIGSHYLEDWWRRRAGYYLNLPALFPNRSRLAIRHIVSGDHVVVPTVRPWAYKNRNYNVGWFKQKWLPYLHKTIGRQYEVSADTIDPMLAHLKQYYPHLIAPPSGPIGPAIGVGSPIGPAPGSGGSTGGVIGEIEAAPAELAPGGG